jgi:subtilisin family serine protease
MQPLPTSLPSLYKGWAWLSGTSMAAPHVAAAAAYIADKYALTTPAAIEAAVRQYSKPYGGRQLVYLPD